MLEEVTDHFNKNPILLLQRIGLVYSGNSIRMATIIRPYTYSRIRTYSIFHTERQAQQAT